MELLTSFVSLLSGLAIFMVGIQLMSSGLETLSSGKIQKGLSKVSNNRFISFGFGAFITGIMQSSTLVTVMTISFLNANLLTLFQGIAIVLGANIGTTLTGVISSFATFNYSIFLALSAMVGVIIDMFAKKAKTKRIAQIFIGFGLIFIGLKFAGDSFKSEEMKQLIGVIFETVNNPILLILISVILTALVHSSSLIVGLSIILVSSSALPIEYGIFIVLGSEIGTTITGLLTSLKGNVNAKRLAVIQLIFNVLGTLIFTTLILLFKNEVLETINIVNKEFQVALFQVFFNVSTALIALIFIKQFEKLSYILIKDKEDSKDEMRLKYINDSLLQTPSFAITALNKEVERMFELALEGLKLSFENICTNSVTNIEKINDIENTIDYLNNSISLYLVKLSNEPLDDHDELIIGKLYHIVNDLERIGDHANNFTYLVKQMLDDGLEFTLSAKEETKIMATTILQMFDLSRTIFVEKEISKLDLLADLEHKVDLDKKTFEQNHITRVRNGKSDVDHSKYFFDLTSQLERVGDHLTNIGFLTIDIVGDIH